MKNQFMSFGFELKKVLETGRIEGYASTFGNLDYYLDIIEPGAFKRTLEASKGKIPVLANHDPYSQIGWGVEAEEDARGLYVKADLDIENNQTAREKYSLAKKAGELGTRAGISIGFYTVRAEPDHDNPSIRRIKEVKLLEYSLVAFPANPEAYVTDAKDWLGRVADADSIKASTNLFVETMRRKGYSDPDIRRALLEVGPAQEKTDPGLAHSFSRTIETIKSMSFPGTHSEEE